MIKKAILFSLLFIGILNATSIVLNKETYTNKENVIVNFTNMTAKNKDWIAIYPKNSSNSWANVVAWHWTDDVPNGQMSFDALVAGEYEVRAFYNNSYKVEAKKEFVVEAVIIDDIKPVITLIGSSEVNITIGTEYNDRGAIANDNVDGNLTNSIVIVNPVNINIVGEYTISYNVQDTSNNRAIQVERIVNVIAEPVLPHEIPELSSQEKINYLSAINKARATARSCGNKGFFPKAPPLIWNNKLYSSAYEHSQDMAISHTFTHNGSGTISDWTGINLNKKSSLLERLDTYNYKGISFSENIAMGSITPNDVVLQWINSDEHCANLMNATFNQVGMAKFESNNIYWTQNFAQGIIPPEKYFPPVITLNGDAYITITKDTNYQDAGATAIDENNNSIDVTIKGTVDTTEQGAYTLVYSAIDNKGRRSVKRRTVNVININPVEKTLFEITPLFGTNTTISFGISLNSKPDSNVTVKYVSSDEDYAKTQNNQIIFTPDDWYIQQNIIIDILDNSDVVDIIFENSISDDINYNNKSIESVAVLFNQIYFEEPYDKVVYSEFNMSLPIQFYYVGDKESNLSVSLESIPNGMTINTEKTKLFWVPPIEMEGEEVIVKIKVSDGNISDIMEFKLLVATPNLLSTIIENDELIVKDTSSALYGMKIKAIDDDVILDDYKIYTINKNNLYDRESTQLVVGDTLLIKGNKGKKVQVSIPLEGMIDKDDILSFNVKSYYGSGTWKRLGYDYNLTGTIDKPIYTLSTIDFIGLVSFTKSIKSINNKKNLQKRVQENIVMQKAIDVNKIECYPYTWFNGLLTDYDHQLCISEDKPGYSQVIFNYTKSTISDSTSIEQVMSWVLEAQDKLDTLEMPYLNWSALSFEHINKNGFTSTSHDVADGLFTNYPIITNYLVSVISDDLTKEKTRSTIHHEYFHHSQASLPFSIAYDPNVRKNKGWLIESMAVWFPSYVDNNFRKRHSGPNKLLEFGLHRDNMEKVTGTWGSIRQHNTNNDYSRYVYFKMLEEHCTEDFRSSVKNLFTWYGNDTYSLMNFHNNFAAMNCDFGTPLGEQYKNRIETSLLHYQYRSAMKYYDSLMNPIETLHNVNHHHLKHEEWEELSQNTSKPKNEKRQWEMSGKYINSQSRTVKIEQVDTELSAFCEQRYIRFKSDNTIFISVSSKDERIPDSPNSMLGDMKNFSAAVKGEYDFNFFYDENNKQFVPEFYLTVIDVVEDASILDEQEVDVYYGIKRINLFTKFQGNNICTGGGNGVVGTSGLMEGEIPKQYRDESDMENYIDRILIINKESGQEYTIIVDENGLWSKTIHFKHNVATVIEVKGYNALNPNYIIHENRLGLQSN